MCGGGSVFSQFLQASRTEKNNAIFFATTVIAALPFITTALGTALMLSTLILWPTQVATLVTTARDGSDTSLTKDMPLAPDSRHLMADGTRVLLLNSNAPHRCSLLSHGIKCAPRTLR